jgi:hypothetical protein
MELAVGLTGLLRTEKILVKSTLNVLIEIKCPLLLDNGPIVMIVIMRVMIAVMMIMIVVMIIMVSVHMFMNLRHHGFYNMDRGILVMVYRCLMDVNTRLVMILVMSMME